MNITNKTLDLETIQSTPKTDLHAHMLLSAPFMQLQKFTHNKIPHPPHRFEDLSDFIGHIKKYYFPCFDNIELFKNILSATLDHMILDGIIYTELSFDISMPLIVNTTWEKLMTELFPIIEKYKNQIQVCPELGLARDFEYLDVSTLIEQALDLNVFKSIDLYGDELIRPAHDFLHFIESARKNGLKIKMHCGESGGAKRLIEEVNFIKPDAIQHGVRSYEDPKALKLLADLKISVNVCPQSNWCLQVIDDYSKHPIRQMFDAGIKVTINSDDYSIFGRSVSEEYLALYNNGLFSSDELEIIRNNGLANIPL